MKDLMVMLDSSSCGNAQWCACALLLLKINCLVVDVMQ